MRAFFFAVFCSIFNFFRFFTDETNLETKQIHPNHSSLKSPDKPFEKQILLPNSHSPIQNPNLLMPNNTNAILNATNSTQSSNFYENTMHSDTSSLQKRKSVISSQSTESSNEVSFFAPFLLIFRCLTDFSCFAGSNIIYTAITEAITSSES